MVVTQEKKFKTDDDISFTEDSEASESFTASTVCTEPFTVLSSAAAAEP